MKPVPPNPIPDSILSRAVKVQGREGFGWCKWLTDHELLLGRGSKATQYTFYRKNLKTGKTHPLRLLTETYYQWNHNHTTFSPDGRYALWRPSGETLDLFHSLFRAPNLLEGSGRQNLIHERGQLMVVSLDGSDYWQDWPDPADEHNSLVWLPDSRHWLVLYQWKNEGDIVTADCFDVRRPEWKTTLRIPMGMGDIGGFTARGNALTYSYPPGCDTAEEARSVTVREIALSLKGPQNHLCPYLHRWQIPVPSGKQLCGLDFSPGGDRIVWTFREESGQRGCSVWVSSTDGKNWRKIGSLPGFPDESEDFSTVDWVPGGKSLTFDWDGATCKLSV